MMDPVPYAASDPEMIAAQNAAVDNAQSTGEFVLDRTDPVTDGTEWWVVFGIGGVDGPVTREFEFRRPVA